MQNQCRSRLSWIEISSLDSHPGCTRLEESSWCTYLSRESHLLTQREISPQLSRRQKGWAQKLFMLGHGAATHSPWKCSLTSRCDALQVCRRHTTFCWGEGKFCIWNVEKRRILLASQDTDTSLITCWDTRTILGASVSLMDDKKASQPTAVWSPIMWKHFMN